MHRAVLLAKNDEIGTDAVIQQDGTPLGRNTSINSENSTNSSEGTQESSQDAQNLVGKTVAQVEKDLILDTLNHCLGNRTHAAKILGISIRTLRNKLKQYNDNSLEIEPSNNSFRAA